MMMDGLLLEKIAKRINDSFIDLFIIIIYIILMEFYNL